MALQNPLYGEDTTYVGNLTSTGYATNTEIRKYDVHPKIWYDRPNISPLLTLSEKGGIGKSKTDSVEFWHFEQRDFSDWTTANGAYSISAQTINVASADHFRVGDIVINATTVNLEGYYEYMRVTAYDTSADTITVSRNFLSSGAAAVAGSDGDYLLVISNTAKEGSSIAEIKQIDPTNVKNYVQLERTPFGGTYEALNQAYKVNGKSWLNKLMKDAFFLHKKKIELSLYHGYPGETTSGSDLYRTTGGLIYWLTNASQTYNVGGTLSMDTLMEIFRLVWDYNTDRSKLIMLASPYFLGGLAKMKWAKLEIRNQEEYFNMSVTEIITPWGVVEAYNAPLLSAPKGATNAYDAFGGTAIILDPQSVEYKYFTEDTKLYTNIQDNDYHGRKDDYRTEFGLALYNPVRHLYVKGITAFSA